MLQVLKALNVSCFNLHRDKGVRMKVVLNCKQSYSNQMAGSDFEGLTSWILLEGLTSKNQSNNLPQSNLYVTLITLDQWERGVYGSQVERS